jgi:16S rRNA (uracil1498-N3)-methyltransferase
MSHAESAFAGPTLFATGLAGRAPGEVVRLEREESRHVRALRLTTDDRIRLTDGAGALWDARVLRAAADGAECVLVESVDAARPLPVELAFGVGNKAHVMWLVEKVTELGVALLSPLESERTRSVADAARSPSFWDKARRRAQAAVKQSGGAWLPEIGEPRALEDYLDELAARERGQGPRVRLEAGAPPLHHVLDRWDASGRIVLLVGPEGGWSDAEQSRLDRAGLVVAGLGSRVLRFETAAVVACGVVAQRALAIP